jgi:hypothetical protein
MQYESRLEAFCSYYLVFFSVWEGRSNQKYGAENIIFG